MELTLRKSEWLDDWYVIERAHHSGQELTEKIGPNCFSYQHSARFSDADVEGTGAEMLAIADAIEKRGRESFRRCAVIVDGDKVSFWSPRNSMENGDCTLAEADELVPVIRAAIAKATGGE